MVYCWIKERNPQFYSPADDCVRLQRSILDSKAHQFGKEIEPKEGKIWRAGANEKTWIEFSKDVTIEGKPLAAGKYGFFTLKNGKDWTLIFSKKWD